MHAKLGHCFLLVRMSHHRFSSFPLLCHSGNAASVFNRVKASRTSLNASRSSANILREIHLYTPLDDLKKKNALRFC